MLGGSDSDGGEGEEESDEGEAGEDEQGSLVGYDVAGGDDEDEDDEAEEEDGYEAELRTLQQDRLKPRDAPSTSQPAAAALPAAKRKRGLEAEEALEGPMDLPYTIPVPETYEA